MIDLLARFRGDAPSDRQPPAGDPPEGSGRIVVIANEKGGCGKSTMAMHLATAYLKGGFRVATVDLDSRQGTLSRYIANRRRYMDAADARIVMPEHFDGAAIGGPNTETPEKQLERLRYVLDGGRANHDLMIVDTPGADTPMGRIAHGHADVILTPLNDSFVDLDVLAQIDAGKKSIIGPSPFAMLILGDQHARAEQGRQAAPWLIARNRLGTLESHNTRDVDWALELLQRKFGVRVVPGFSERVIFRELFLLGLTILDLKDAAGGQPLSRSHIAARQEVAAIADIVRSYSGLATMDSDAISSTAL